MTITDEHRHQLEVADRTRDVDVIAAVVDSVIAEGATALEVEIALRDAAAQSYLVSDTENQVSIVIGMAAWLETLAAADLTPNQNRAALAALSKE